MSWSYDKSKERIQKHADSLDGIEIQKLKKEADLNSLLTEKRCREISGAHVYINVSNFADMATKDASDQDEYKRLIQANHVYQREVARIVEHDDKFDGLRVHFQGAKLHALFYRPIDDAERIATKAFLLLCVIKDFVKNVFNANFQFYEDFQVVGGTDIGDAIGTRNGSPNDRELLFLGAPANYAAKILNESGQLRLTKMLHEALPKDLKALCIEKSDDIYQIKNIEAEDLDKLLEKHNISWSREESENRIKEDKRRFPLKDIEYSNSKVLIDIDSLGITNNKRVDAASIFADVTGFTSYIDSADSDEKKIEALKVLHVIRKEMSTVLKTDFSGIRVQFQGDRVQGLFHIPKDDEDKISTEVVEAAIGLQSSMEKTIKDVLPEASNLKLAIGIDLDITLVTKLGTHAHRDRICIGKPVECAAEFEEKCAGAEIGISTRIFKLLPERLSKHFAYDKSKGCYVAADLTADKVERAEKAASAVAGAPAFITSDKSGTTVSTEESENARRIIPARSYGTE